jgi:hypothetical protein
VPTRAIVHWECQAPLHRAVRSRHGNGGLTINDGAWAYCDGAGADEAHQWLATGGVPLESLVRWTAPNGAPTELTVPAPNGDRPPSSPAGISTNGRPKSPRKRSGVRRP